jgi:hypothetical protein
MKAIEFQLFEFGHDLGTVDRNNGQRKITGNWHITFDGSKFPGKV